MLGGHSDLLRLMARAKHLRLGQWNLAATLLFVVLSQYASCLRHLDEALLVGHPDLLRLMARAKHLRLGHWNLAATSLFLVLSQYASCLRHLT